jgi:hypothetical protein
LRDPEVIWGNLDRRFGRSANRANNVVAISVKGFIDMHAHTGPAPFKRIGDTVDVARWCAEAGMGGLVVKSHFEATIAKVYHARKAVPDLPIFSAIALNVGVGGVNPGAVEQALRQDAKVVWMPTIDAEHHKQVFGSSGAFGAVGSLSYDAKSKRKENAYTVLKVGRLTPEARDVVDVVREFDAVLATGHISKAEIIELVRYAIERGVKKIVITHPEMYTPNLDIPTQVELARQGCTMEYCALNCMPMFHCVTPEQLREMIDAVTPQQATLATDSGQFFSPRAPELFRIFAQTLFERGVSLSAIAQMAIVNPARLLGLEPARAEVEFTDFNVGMG